MEFAVHVAYHVSTIYINHSGSSATGVNANTTRFPACRCPLPGVGNRAISAASERSAPHVSATGL